MSSVGLVSDARVDFKADSLAFGQVRTGLRRLAVDSTHVIVRRRLTCPGFNTWCKPHAHEGEYSFVFGLTDEVRDVHPLGLRCGHSTHGFAVAQSRTSHWRLCDAEGLARWAITWASRAVTLPSGPPLGSSLVTSWLRNSGTNFTDIFKAFKASPNV